MSLTESEIAWLRKIEPEYKYKQENARHSQVSLTSIASPSRGGKSTLIAGVIDLARELSYGEKVINEVDTRTTRRRRPDDPSGYLTFDEGIGHEWMLDCIRSKQLVNWALFENGDMYATDRNSYKAAQNLLPTQVKALPMLGKAALFHTLHVIYVVRPVEDWLENFPEVITTTNHLGRLQEAVTSLEYAGNAGGITRVVNYKDEKLFKKTCGGILKIAMSNHANYQSNFLDDYHEKDFDMHREAMLSAAQKLIENAQIEA